MEVILDLDIPIAEDIRLIKRLYKADNSEACPGGLFALQYLWRVEGKWVEVARIDNYKHDRTRSGAHIHKFGRDFVEFREMNFEEAEQYVITLGEKIRRKMLLGDYNG